jgi:MFS family permease
VKEVLKLPAYRRLLAAYALTLLAWWVGAVTLALLVYRKTGSAIGTAAFFLCAQFGPALISPLLVARVDQRSPRRVLPVLYVLEALAFLALAWLASHFALAPVLALVLVDGAIGLAALSLARATAARVTSGAGLLREGNALANGTSSVCFMAGPAVGGGIVAVGGTPAALLANACLFSVIALTLATATILPQSLSERAPITGRLRAALQYARRHAAIRRTLLLQAVAFVFFTIATPVEVVLVEHSLHAGVSGYGFLLSAWGAGAVVGSVVYARWRSRPGRELVTFGAGLIGIGFCVMAIAPSLATAVAGAAVAGGGNGVEVVAVRTLIQEEAQEGWMTMIMSFVESLTEAVPGAGIALGGAIAAIAGPRAALAVAGGGSLAIAGLVWLVLRPGQVESGSLATALRPDGPSDRGLIEAASRRD